MITAGLVGAGLGLCLGYFLGRRRAPAAAALPHRPGSASALEAGAEAALPSPSEPSLEAALEVLRVHRRFDPVVLADASGLVVGATGSPEAAELLAIDAVAYRNAPIEGRVERLVHASGDTGWTVHRYFSVDGAGLSLSAFRSGPAPDPHALDDALAPVFAALGGTGRAEPDGHPAADGLRA